MDGLRFASGEELEAELVVIAAGIKPNADLAREAGLEVNRGIVVNDFMETSDPDIFAVGECTEHRGQTFGLVAPLFDQARVLAATITENRGPVFSAPAPAAKLKIMGVDIFSAGSIDENEPGVEVVRYEDPALGAYKKLLIKDNRLHGMILVGDIEDEPPIWNGCAAGPISLRCAGNCFSRRRRPIPASKSPTCRTAKPSADATAFARAKSSRRFTNTASRRWAS